MTAERPTVLVTDRLSGGAGHAARTLFSALVSRGVHVECWHFSEDEPQDRGTVLSLDPAPRRPVFERALKNLSRDAANRMRRRRHTRALLQAVSDRQPRLIHLHNLHASGLDHSSLRQLPRDIPLAWSLHDCWPIAPDPFRWFDKQLNRWETTATAEVERGRARQRRVEFFDTRPDAILAAPSRWMAAEAGRVVGARLRIEHIPYGIDLGRWRPLPKADCRTQLQLNPELFWVGSAAFSAQRRKGLDLLAAALGSLSTRGIGLLLWGDTRDLQWPSETTVKDAGPVTDPDLINTLYSACDVFVCPSRMDNFPLTVLESMACGTAVLASDCGGTAEAIDPGVTGEVFEGSDSTHLSAGLQRLTREADPEQMGRAARARLASLFSCEQEARRWEGVYRELPCRGRLKQGARQQGHHA